MASIQCVCQCSLNGCPSLRADALQRVVEAGRAAKQPRRREGAAPGLSSDDGVGVFRVRATDAKQEISEFSIAELEDKIAALQRELADRRRCHGESPAPSPDARLVSLPLLLGTCKPCLYYRHAEVDPTHDGLRAMFEAIRAAECMDWARVPKAARLFPDGVLQSRPVYLLKLGLMASKWELKVRSGHEEQAARRLGDAPNLLAPLPPNNVVMWQVTPQILMERASTELPRANININSVCDTLLRVGRADYDDDFELAINQDDSVKAHLFRSALKSIILTAKAENAAVIIPNYHGYDAMRLIHEILEEALFEGPVVAVNDDNILAHVSETNNVLPPPVRQFMRRAGKNVVQPGATHAVVITGQENVGPESTRHFHLTALLSTALAGLTPVLPSAAPCTLYSVISNGGREGLKMAHICAQQLVPMLLLQGSGRLADALSSVYPQRFNTGFDLEMASKDAIRACGFHSEPTDEEGERV